jgi:hypothetical protein
LRIAYCGQLVTDPAARAAAPGFFLLRAYLLGAQDVTITDSAGAETRRMWRTLGGSAAYLPSLTWLRPLRAKAPVSLVLDLARSRRARGRRGRSEPKPSAAAFRGDASGDLAALTSGRLREAFDAVVRHYRFHVVHDERTFDWLLAGLASVPQRGRLAGAIVVDRDRPVGWFLYLVAPTGIADVLQVGAAPSDAAQVLVALRRHARSEGASLLRGRVEAHLLEPLGITKSFFRFNGSALIAGRDADALAAVQSGHALLSRTDGDWWMGHATEDFGKAR